jgi:hypothetical protein
MTEIVDRIVEGLEKDGARVSMQTKEKMEMIMKLINEVINELKNEA